MAIREGVNHVATNSSLARSAPARALAWRASAAAHVCRPPRIMYLKLLLAFFVFATYSTLVTGVGLDPAIYAAAVTPVVLPTVARFGRDSTLGVFRMLTRMRVERSIRSPVCLRPCCETRGG